MTIALTIDPATCDAVIFDMGAVLTERARVHARASAETFGEHLRIDPDGLRLVRALLGAGIRTAVISASRSARQLLERAGIGDLFEVRIDGDTAAVDPLRERPSPDVFLEAARRLGAEARRCAIVEDTTSGVQAGRRGGFGWVIGVAREGDAERLVSSGADLVVKGLGEIAVAGCGREQPVEGLPCALDRVPSIARLVGRRQAVLFLDFDGTLAPIVERPEDARLPRATRDVLADLAARRSIAIVSGRDLEDLRARVGLEHVYYVGSHGLDLAGPRGWSHEHQGARRVLPALARAEAELRRALPSGDGIQVERKRHAVAVHFRRAEEGAASEVRRVVERVCRTCGQLRIGEGRKVIELRPAIDWDEGDVVRLLLETLDLDGANAFAIYIADDVTDEHAFRVVEQDGLGILVRGREGFTRARYGLAHPAEVREFLVRLDKALGAA